MRMRNLVPFLCFTLSAGVVAKQIIVEDIARYDEKEHFFIVEQAYEVGPDDRLVIIAGLKVYFAPLTYIDVKGEMIIDGKPQDPVIFQSRRAALGNGAAHDWGGIKVFQGGSLIANYAVISNASVGIKTCCDNVSLLNTSFHTNGVHFQMGDKRFTVFDREPISYVRVPERATVVLDAPKDLTETPKRGKKYAEVVDKGDNGVLSSTRFWILAPIAAGCLVTGSIYIPKWAKASDKYVNYDPRITGDNYVTAERKLKDYKSDRDGKAGMTIGFLGAGVLAGGYVVYYTVTF
jgi:hypothetical protein